MIIYGKFEIPGGHPIPTHERGPMGPSAELVPFEPSALSPDHVVGRMIDEMSLIVGTYGMGGPGFFGLRLGSEWLIVSIWGAGDWIEVNGRQVSDMFYHKTGRPKPWIVAGEDGLTKQIVGQRIASLHIERTSLAIGLGNGLAFVIQHSADTRPRFEGSKEPRAFKEIDDLRRAVFLCPTAELWV